MKLPFKSKILSAIGAVALMSFATIAPADELTDRINDGEPIRLGFATAIPWAYPGDNGEPLGFVNALTLVVLEEMGITNYETSVNEWWGLIPGLQANRYDIITGGMYILKSRCENINFSDPIGLFGDAMLVPAGNPQGIHNYQDVIKTGARLVTGAGFNTVEAAKKEGVPDSQMMLVAGEVEILAAMKAVARMLLFRPFLVPRNMSTNLMVSSRSRIRRICPNGPRTGLASVCAIPTPSSWPRSMRPWPRSLAARSGWRRLPPMATPSSSFRGMTPRPSTPAQTAKRRPLLSCGLAA